MMFIEAKCSDCGETFIPASLDEEDLEHYVRSDEDFEGDPCGGIGEISRILFNDENELIGALLHRLAVHDEGMPPLAYRPIPKQLGKLLADDELTALERAWRDAQGL